MKRVGEGFKRVSKANNNPFIAIEIDLGALGTFKAMMFQNSKKKSPEEPDYNITIADDKPTVGPRPQAAKAPYVKPKITPRNTRPPGEPDIPEPDWTHPVDCSAWNDGTPMP